MKRKCHFKISFQIFDYIFYVVLLTFFYQSVYDVIEIFMKIKKYSPTLKVMNFYQKRIK